MRLRLRKELEDRQDILTAIKTIQRRRLKKLEEGPVVRRSGVGLGGLGSRTIPRFRGSRAKQLTFLPFLHQVSIFLQSNDIYHTGKHQVCNIETPRN